MTNRNIFERKIVGVIVCTLLISVSVFSVAGSMIFQTDDFLSLSSYNSSDNRYGITWDDTLHFNETGDNIDSVVFGEAPDACDGPTGSGPDGNDIYDVMKPPAPPSFPYLRATFDDGLTGTFATLQADYRQYPDTSKVWNLSVLWMPSTPAPTDVTITWDPCALGLSEYNSVVLYDVSTSSVVADMLVDTEYSFTAPAYAPTSFQIIFICSTINEPPVFSNENPLDGSVDVSLTTSQLTVIISDPEGDTFDWTIETSPDIGSSSGAGESNGTKICSISGLEYDTTYTWYVNATDSGSGTAREEVYTFTTESVPNEPPYEPSDPDPENGSIDVSINTNLNWTGGDPDGDDVTYDVYFGTTTTPPQVSSNQPDTTYDPGTMNHDTIYYWKIIAWDNHDASTTGPIWDFKTEIEPVPNLDCDGTLDWVDVTSGSTVTDSFTVENIGDPDSELDWEIESHPDWGTWNFTPSSGNDLTPEDGHVTVSVSVVAPDEQNQDFTGEVKIVNSDDPDDFCIIDVSLATPVSQNSFILQFLERLIQRFPMLDLIFPFLDKILNLKYY